MEWFCFQNPFLGIQELRHPRRHPLRLLGSLNCEGKDEKSTGRQGMTNNSHPQQPGIFFVPIMPFPKIGRNTHPSFQPLVHPEHLPSAQKIQQFCNEKGNYLKTIRISFNFETIVSNSYKWPFILHCIFFDFFEDLINNEKSTKIGIFPFEGMICKVPLISKNSF